jgi:hypothetical protein
MALTIASGSLGEGRARQQAGQRRGHTGQYQRAAGDHGGSPISYLSAYRPERV